MKLSLNNTRFGNDLKGILFVYKFYKEQNSSSIPTPSAGVTISPYLDNKPVKIKQ
jgi:hypothetical protein